MNDNQPKRLVTFEQTKEIHLMKTMTQLHRILIRSALLLSMASLTWLPDSALAQEKGAERLMKLTRLNSVAEVEKVEAGDTVVMSCPKCKDIWVKVVRPAVKRGQETTMMAQHQCPGCDTKFVTEGAGKQAKSVVKHVCKQCGSEDASCCVIKKGSDPTKGTEHSEDQH
jgi:hypothetical protein